MREAGFLNQEETRWHRLGATGRVVAELKNGKTATLRRCVKPAFFYFLERETAGMKIIGIDGDGHAICLMKASELRAVSNDDRFDYRGDLTDYGSVKKGAVGVELEVSDRWSRMAEIEKNRERFDSAIRQLRACAEMLEPLGPSVVLPEVAATPPAKTPIIPKFPDQDVF